MSLSRASRASLPPSLSLVTAAAVLIAGPGTALATTELDAETPPTSTGAGSTDEATPIADFVSETGTASEPDPQPALVPDPEPVTGPEAAPDPEPVTGPEPVAAPEPVTAPNPEPTPGSGLTPGPEPVAAPEPVATPSPTEEPTPAPAGITASPAVVEPPDDRAIAESLLMLLGWTGPGPSEAALAELPDGWLERYQAAASRCDGLDWAVLAGLGKTVSDHGRDAAGPSGLMGLRQPAWEMHRVDGNDDGFVLIHDPDDAVHTAAERLCAAGAADDSLISALRIYEPRWAVVHEVLEHAARYREAITEFDTGLPDARPEMLLANENLTIYAGGRDDLAAGRIDPRVRQVLAVLAGNHELTVVSLQTGHSKYVAGTTSVSHHWHGRGVDIAVLDGTAVNSGHAGARALVTWLAGLPDGVRPDEVGSPFSDSSGHPGFFTDGNHLGHVHIAWRAAPVR